jgi:hypothetical protein
MRDSTPGPLDTQPLYVSWRSPPCLTAPRLRTVCSPSGRVSPPQPRMPRRRQRQLSHDVQLSRMRRRDFSQRTHVREQPKSPVPEGETPAPVGEAVDALPFGHLPRSFEQDARAFDHARFSWGDFRALPARAQGERCLDGSRRFVSAAAYWARARREEERDTGGLGGWAFSRPRTVLQTAAATRATSARLAGVHAQRRSQHSTSRNPRSPGPAYYQPDIWCGTHGGALAARRRAQQCVGVRC